MTDQKLTVLFAPAQGMGHIGACHGLAELVRDRGHRVVFAMDIQFKGRLAKYGYEEAILQTIGPETYSATEEDLIAKYFADNSGDNDVVKLNALDVAKGFFQLFVDMFDDWKKLETNYRAVVDTVRPDIIVCDTHIASPALMNNNNDIPWVLLSSCAPLEIYSAIHGPDRLPPAWSGLSINDSKDKWLEFHGQSVELFADLRQSIDNWYYDLCGKHLTEAHGLQPLSKHLNIYMTPEELDYKQIVGELDHKLWFGVNGFVRHTTNNDKVSIPDWLVQRPGKLILLSMGSLLTGNLDLMKHITQSLAKSDHKFIVSLGRRHHNKYTLPDNQWGQPFLPQTSLLPQVDAFITHGGNNSVTEGFYFGKPLLLLPVCGDQFDNAQRLVDTKLGYRLDLAKCTANELIAAVDMLANDCQLSDRMKTIGQRIRASDDRCKVVDRIECIARNGV
ncbi:uncharacterized UDP-glucosyltransferase YojK-like [Oppia nitens]|uniref:uncharacterized UDP-glucosyltransferase YojK-like n=1 Tax=Oppia nitens TaxID=1686743 RepID=UPI0023DA911B|nr:uncharacterized UDP-glucosyltransferase YojK-like [Oppia nitens]